MGIGWDTWPGQPVWIVQAARPEIARPPLEFSMHVGPRIVRSLATPHLLNSGAIRKFESITTSRVLAGLA